MISWVSRLARERFHGRYPVHVTMRLVEGLPSLRRGKAYRLVRRVLREFAGTCLAKVVHFSVMTNHLHFIVEAAGAKALSKAMQSLTIRLAKGLNAVMGRKRGTVFSDRYHARVLRTPREVKNALCYVLQNARKHAAQLGRKLARGFIDPCSSAPYFDGYRGRRGLLPPPDEPALVNPGTWLLQTGWRYHGLIAVDAVPRV
jgi:REP element-mobilizing transposase RayT